MKIKSITSNHSYEQYDIDGNIIISNQYPGSKSKYFYDKDKRLNKVIVVEDDGNIENVYEHKYEYNSFGYRISVFKIKKTYPITSWSDDPKTKTEETYEPISTIDVRTENGKVISETITNFKSKTIEEKNLKPKEEEYITESNIGKYDNVKYDEKNRVIESIAEGDYDINITEYQYSLIDLEDSLGGSSTYHKTLTLSFTGMKGEEGLTDKDELLLEGIYIKIFDDDDNIINTISQSNIYQQTSNPIKRTIDNNDKYYADGKALFIDRTLDNVKKDVGLYEYKWITKDKQILMSITYLSIINDNISIIDKIEYSYFNE